MQLVAHVEKTNRPTRTAVCEASASAVAQLLEHADTQPALRPAIDRWLSGRIRKHFRRARGAAWKRVQDLPGLTTIVAGAEVRALIPTATDAIPLEVSKLQLSGSELSDPEVNTELDPSEDGPVIVSICPDPFLPLGKAAAAAGHAAQIAAIRMDRGRYATWKMAGFPVRVEHPDRGRWASLRSIAQVEIVDAGFTVVNPGTATALARWA